MNAWDEIVAERSPLHRTIGQYGTEAEESASVLSLKLFSIYLYFIYILSINLFVFYL